VRAEILLDEDHGRNSGDGCREPAGTSRFDKVMADRPQTDIVTAHTRSIRHREEILASKVCGCFFCLAVFPVSEIKEWVDTIDGIGQTALCPKCDIDSVIGSNSGYPIEREFLSEMRKHWF
jgi:hypothetical protein